MTKSSGERLRGEEGHACSCVWGGEGWRGTTELGPVDIIARWSSNLAERRPTEWLSPVFWSVLPETVRGTYRGKQALDTVLSSIHIPKIGFPLHRQRRGQCVSLPLPESGPSFTTVAIWGSPRKDMRNHFWPQTRHCILWALGLSWKTKMFPPFIVYPWECVCCVFFEIKWGLCPFWMSLPEGLHTLLQGNSDGGFTNTFRTEEHFCLESHVDCWRERKWLRWLLSRAQPALLSLRGWWYVWSQQVCDGLWSGGACWKKEGKVLAWLHWPCNQN